MTLFFDLIAVFGFGLLLLLIYQTQRNLFGHPSRLFLTAFAGLYLAVGVANMLRHGGIVDVLGKYEYLAGLFFPPVFLFFVFPVFSLYIFSIFMRQDMVRRLQAEEDIRVSESRYRQLFENSLEGRCLLRDNRVVSVNDMFLQLFGSNDVEKFMKARLDEYLLQNERERFQLCVEAQVGKKQECCREFEIQRADGKRRTVEMLCSSVDAGHETLVQCAFHDITEMKRIEREIENTRLFLQSVIDGITDAVMVIDCHYQVKLINEAVSRLYAVPSQIEGLRYCYQVSHNQDKPCGESGENCPLAQVIATGRPVMMVHRHRRHDGSPVMLEIAASPIVGLDGKVSGIIEVGRDVTEKLRLAEEKRRFSARILQEQKEQSVAVLARGMAHDFNNLLAMVQGNVELLQMDAGSRQAKHLDLIANAAARMIELTSQLSAYAKEGKYQEKALRLSDKIEEALQMLGSELLTDIVIEKNIPEDQWAILADPAQILQLILNLLQNAIEAIDKEKGNITIAIENRQQMDEWECSQQVEHRAGDYVHLRIADSGRGIPEKMQQTLFEPFVSSKALGRGLGLAAALGIAHNHGGCITAQSVVGQGAVFHVFLPAMKNADHFHPKGNSAGEDSLPEARLLQ
ncbi:MAG: PAS domain S-box protein [Deltaproteobacteria bacterium]